MLESAEYMGNGASPLHMLAITDLTRLAPTNLPLMSAPTNIEVSAD